MPFPPCERVVYQKNPLVEVVCQLRVPPIERIEKESPDDFLAALKDKYPVLRESKTITTSLQQDMGVDSIQISKNESKLFEFNSADDEWKVSLASDSISLATARYSRWEHFNERLQDILNIYCQIYRPNTFTRVGLRYQDIIVRSDLGLQDYSWAQLLRPAIVGPLASQEFGGSEIKNYRSTFLVPLEEGFVQIQHGFVTKVETQEECYLIDSDFFIVDVDGVSDAIASLQAFNRKAGSLFRNCISELLYNSLGPSPIAS